MIINVIYALGCSFLWAGSMIAGKMISGGHHALVIAFTRYAITVLCLLPFIPYREYKKVRLHHLPWFMLLGLTTAAIFNGLLFAALQYTSALTISLILTMHPVITLLFASILFKRLPSAYQLCAFMLSFAGGVLVITQGRIGYEIFSGSIGEFLMLGAVISQVIYTLIIKKVSDEFSPFFLTFMTGIFGLLFLLPLLINQGLIEAATSFTYTDWALLLYIGCAGSALGISWYSVAIRGLGSAMASLLVYSTLPIFVFMFALLILADHISVWQVSGGLLVLLSLFLGLKS